MIFVYSDWTANKPPLRLGILRVHAGRTSDVFDFTFDSDALTDTTAAKFTLDPDIAIFAGPQFPKDGRAAFGIVKDSSPDRWGETLIRRRFERDKRAGVVAQNARLSQADYLLGVHDIFRSGARRYKRTSDGPFLDDRFRTAAPPFVRLRELEVASRAIEADVDNDDPATDEWLRLLLAPGASLGGGASKGDRRRR